MEYEHLIVEKKYPIGYITINRPERRNALAAKTLQELEAGVDEMRLDPEIRVFVLKGAGECFCSGFDISGSEPGLFSAGEKYAESLQWMSDLEGEVWARYVRSGGFLTNPESKPLGINPNPFQYFWDHPKPSIAQIHSFVLGAGLWIANSCDITVATPTAVLGYPPPRQGASVTLGALSPWLMGRKKTLEMAFTGKAITAEEGFRYGLINHIYHEDKIDEEVYKLALSIAKIPPITNMFSKRAINNYFDNLGINQANRFGTALNEMTENSRVPGHLQNLSEEIRRIGMKEALKKQYEEYSTPDDVLERESARLKAMREQQKKG